MLGTAMAHVRADLRSTQELQEPIPVVGPVRCVSSPRRFRYVLLAGFPTSAQCGGA